MTTIEVNFGRLNALFEACNQVGNESVDLTEFFQDKVCDGSGFDYPECALKPIGDMLPKVAGWFNDAMTGFERTWTGVQRGIYSSARALDKQDYLAHHTLSSYLACAANPPSIENFHLQSVRQSLPAPPDGGSSMKHDSKFDAAADAWDTSRDIINNGIDILNKVGAGIDKLPEQGLRDYLVYPLAADYTAIGRDANACKEMKAGFHTWGHNFGQLSAKTPQALKGATGRKVMLTFGAFDTYMNLAGETISKGSVAFDGIAKVSERIAVEVEKVLVMLGTKLTSVAERVALRVVPFAGEIVTAFKALKDLIEGNSVLKQFEDIIRDIETIQKIIRDCLHLKSTILEWAHTQAHRLETFRDVLDTLHGLPNVATLPDLGTLTQRLGQAKHNLGDVDWGKPGGPGSKLNGKLNGLSGKAGSEGSDPLLDGDLSNGELYSGDPSGVPSNVA